MGIEDLNREDLLFLIYCYNNYVVDFYENHEAGMQPFSVYEFFYNEFLDTLFQEIIKEVI